MIHFLYIKSAAKEKSSVKYYPDIDYLKHDLIISIMNMLLSNAASMILPEAHWLLWSGALHPELEHSDGTNCWCCLWFSWLRPRPETPASPPDTPDWPAQSTQMNNIFQAFIKQLHGKVFKDVYLPQTFIRNSSSQKRGLFLVGSSFWWERAKTVFTIYICTNITFKNIYIKINDINHHYN